MKILLIKDVPKLGRAGDVKKVANGYGRNYLIPQGMAILATPSAAKQADRIREKADAQRAILNQEMQGISNILQGKTISFAVRASETGRLYGSVTTRMIADEVLAQFEVEVSHRQIEAQPLRTLGVYAVPVRLTIDLLPEITVIVHREGEAASLTEEEYEEEFEESDEEEVEVEEAAEEEEAGEEETEA